MRRTVKVRIAVAVASDGDYIAYGLAGLTDQHVLDDLLRMRDGWTGDDESAVKTRMVTVRLPLPVAPRRAPVTRGGRRAKGRRR